MRLDFEHTLFYEPDREVVLTVTADVRRVHPDERGRRYECDILGAVAIATGEVADVSDVTDSQWADLTAAAFRAYVLANEESV